MQLGHRKHLLFSQLAGLLFETEQQASNYKVYCAETLATGTGDLISLDGERISARGITAGNVLPAASRSSAGCCWFQAVQESKP